MQLSEFELQSLEVISNDCNISPVPRIHLEKLSRLDLIEPKGCNVTLSLKGKEILFKGKK